MYRKFGKRMLDIALSTAALLVLWPVLLLIALWVKLDSPGPVIFKQQRIGLHGVRFDMYKFRTMQVDAPHDVPTHLLKNPQACITECGRFLRKTSLDELPQIWNILRGDMSVVGPRPALWNQYDLIEARDRYQANGVRPGLTGWAQINGRDELAIDVKARYDGEYVKKIGFLFDCRCVLGTVGKVLRREGVVEGGEAEGEIGVK